MPESRYLVLIPMGDEWHIATRAGRLITTSERTQIGLGRIEGRRPPVILADLLGSGQVHLPTVDLLELVTDQAAPTSE